MASVSQRVHTTRVSYQVRWSDSRTHRRMTETFSDETSANLFRSMVELNGERTPFGWVPGLGFPDGDAPTGATSFGDAFTSFLASRAPSTLPATLAKYRRMGDVQFLPRWRRRAIADLNLDDIQGWVNDRSKQVSAKTVANEHVVLFGVLERAIQSGSIASNPCRHTRLPKSRQVAKGEGYLTPAQFQAIVAAAKPDARDLLMFAALTGARWGELAAITPGDVTEDDNVVWVHIDKATSMQPGEDGVVRQEVREPKTEASLRDIALTAPAVRAYALALADAAGRRGTLFAAPRGAPWRYSTFRNHRWAPALATARLVYPTIPEATTFHWIRHSFAWWSLDAGNTPVAVRDQMGHKDISMTVNRYGGLTNKARAALLAAAQDPYEGVALPAIEQ